MDVFLIWRIQNRLHLPTLVMASNNLAMMGKRLLPSRALSSALSRTRPFIRILSSRTMPFTCTLADAAPPTGWLKIVKRDCSSYNGLFNKISYFIELFLPALKVVIYGSLHQKLCAISNLLDQCPQRSALLVRSSHKRSVIVLLLWCVVSPAAEKPLGQINTWPKTEQNISIQLVSCRALHISNLAISKLLYIISF